MTEVDHRGRPIRRAVAVDLTWDGVLRHLAEHPPLPGWWRVVVSLVPAPGGLFDCALIDRQEGPPPPDAA